MYNRKRRVRVVFGVAAAVLATAGINDPRAATVDYEVTAGAGQSDNIRRTEDNEQSETIASAGLQFSLDQRSARVDADVVADVAYNDYLEDTFDSEFLGNVAADVKFGLVHDRLDWQLSDYFGQVLTDPFAPPTPETRENLNYLSTGPDLRLPVGSKSLVTAGAHYLKTNYEDSPFDWSGFAANAGLARQVSALSTLGVNLNYQTVDYDVEQLEADYKQSEAFATYGAEGARTNLKLDLGYTFLDRDVSDEREDGLLVRADVSRRIGTRSLLAFQAGQQFGNSANSFSSQQTAGGIGLDAVPGRQTAEPFRDRYVSFDWTATGSRTRISVGGSWRDQKYDSQRTLDQTLAGLRTDVSRDLTPALMLDVGVSGFQGSFETPGRDYDELSGHLGLQWRLSRYIVTNLSLDYFDRSSDAIGGDYSETRLWLTIGYRHGVPRTTMRDPEFAVDR